MDGMDGCESGRERACVLQIEMERKGHKFGGNVAKFRNSNNNMTEISPISHQVGAAIGLSFKMRLSGLFFQI